MFPNFHKLLLSSVEQKQGTGFILPALSSCIRSMTFKQTQSHAMQYVSGISNQQNVELLGKDFINKFEEKNGTRATMK
jgi:metallophosphoesterase superfamily enzyme